MTQSFTPRKSRKYIGKYQPRRADGMKKARGQAEYLDDICLPSRFPGMLYAKVLTSPIPHGRIRKIDASKALALPGVHTVLTCFDPEIRKLKPTTHSWASVGSTEPYNRWASLRFYDQRVLGDTFHFYGEKNGAVVAAETEEIAERALRLLEIEWEELPFYLSPKESLQPGAHPIHPEINPAGNRLPAEVPKSGEQTCAGEDLYSKDAFFEKGNVEDGFARSDVVVEWTSSHHNADHACLDTMGCMVEWKDGQLV
jgi:putative selenate reductase molybdopterin-binding subunit